MQRANPNQHVLLLAMFSNSTFRAAINFEPGTDIITMESPTSNSWTRYIECAKLVTVCKLLLGVQKAKEPTNQQYFIFISRPVLARVS